jgi:hypothetical protein
MLLLQLRPAFSTDLPDTPGSDMIRACSSLVRSALQRLMDIVRAAMMTGGFV